MQTADMTPFQRALTPADVNALCQAGLRAWRQATGRTRVVRFRWRGQAFRAHHTSFRLMIQEPDGTPVACCYD